MGKAWEFLEFLKMLDISSLVVYNVSKHIRYGYGTNYKISREFLFSSINQNLLSDTLGTDLLSICINYLIYQIEGNQTFNYRLRMKREHCELKINIGVSGNSNLILRLLCK